MNRCHRSARTSAAIDKTRQFDLEKNDANDQCNGKQGFSCIELLVVVAIIDVLASITVPKMSRGSRKAGDHCLKMNLTVLRNAIQRYAAEHEGKFSDQQFAAQLTQYSDLSGATSPTSNPLTGKVLGSYLKSVPPLPISAKKGNNDIDIESAAGTYPTGAGPRGWWYNAADRVIRANLSAADYADDGTPYNTY